MLTLEGFYYPPASARRVSAQVILTPDGHVHVHADGEHHSYHVSEISISRGLAGLPRVFALPDRAKIECQDRPEIVEWIESQTPHRRTALVQRLERRWRWVTASVALVAAAVIWAIFFGIPHSAAWLSRLIPDQVPIEVGNQTEALVMRTVGGAGQLDPELYDGLLEQFAVLAAAQHDDAVPLRLKFRRGGAIGPNAFAIPNGTIVITDEMIAFADDVVAVLGVLAHEIGHLHYRHGMQMAIQASSLPLLVALITGDLGSGSALLGTIPMSLVKNGYSRDHEREADRFARDLLRQHGMSHTAFG